MENNYAEKEAEFVTLFTRNGAPFDYEKQLFNDHYLHVLSTLIGASPPPYEIEIQPTGRCNLHCGHCFGTALTCERLPDKMGQAEMEVISKRIAEFNLSGLAVETVKFCGTTGEPLVNPNTVYGIKLFKDKGKKVILYTNGLWLNKTTDNGTEYMDFVLDADKINLSLDAGSKDTFAALKGVDGFERTIENLQRLARKRNATKSRLRIDVSYVIGQLNYREIFRAAKAVKAAGADNMVFRVDFVNPKSIKTILAEIKKQKEQTLALKSPSFNVSFAYSDEELDPESKKGSSAFYAQGKKCFNHNFWACVGPDCHLYTCGHRTYSGVQSFGNLLEHPLEELWHAKERLEKVKNLPDEKCKFCSPSCHRRDCLMNLLATIEPHEVQALHKKYVEKKGLAAQEASTPEVVPLAVPIPIVATQ